MELGGPGVVCWLWTCRAERLRANSCATLPGFSLVWSGVWTQIFLDRQVFWPQFIGFLKMHWSVQTRNLSVPWNFISNPNTKDIQDRSGWFCICCLRALVSLKLTLEPKAVFDGNREFSEERLTFGRDYTVVLLDNQFTTMREGFFQCRTWPLHQEHMWVEYALQMLHKKVTVLLPYHCHYGIYTIIQIVGMSQEC